MNKEQAVSVLITGAKIGQAKGAFTLEDASVIMEAIKVLSPKPEVKEPVLETETVSEPLDK